MDCIHVVHVSVHWQALVNTVLNHQVTAE